MLTCAKYRINLSYLSLASPVHFNTCCDEDNSIQVFHIVYRILLLHDVSIEQSDASDH